MNVIETMADKVKDNNRYRNALGSRSRLWADQVKDQGNNHGGSGQGSQRVTEGHEGS